MIVNSKKTQAILMATGKDKGKIHKNYVCTSGDGKRLLVSPKCPDQWVPLVPHAEYLGLVIAFDRFEALSTRHRIQKANQRRWILASALHSRKLSIKYKLQIWRSCVQSTLLYGLHSFCLSPKLARELQATAMTHVRAVVSDLRHLTGHTNQEVQQKHNIENMLTILEKAHSRELKLTQYDWMTLPEWDMRISQCLKDAQRAKQQTDLDSDEDEQWACPECDSFFHTAVALKVHAQRAHGWTRKPLKIFDRSRHAKHGLPTCNFCDKRYSRWQTLEQHINTVACPKMLVIQAGEGTHQDVQIRPLAQAEEKEDTGRQSDSESETAWLSSDHPHISSWFDKQQREASDISYL